MATRTASTTGHGLARSASATAERDLATRATATRATAAPRRTWMATSAAASAGCSMAICTAPPRSDIVLTTHTCPPVLRPAPCHRASDCALPDLCRAALSCRCSAAPADHSPPPAAAAGLPAPAGPGSPPSWSGSWSGRPTRAGQAGPQEQQLVRQAHKGSRPTRASWSGRPTRAAVGAPCPTSPPSPAAARAAVSCSAGS